MPYTPGVPLANQKISASQPIIKANFVSIQQGFDQNHVDFNGGLNVAGQHTFIQLQPQAAWPAVGSFPGSVGFWADNTAGNDIMVHTAAGLDYDISNIAIAVVAPTGQQGSTILPSGLIMKWGFVPSGGADGPIDVVFAAAFPNNNYSVTATIFDDAAPPIGCHFYLSIAAWTNAQFTAQRNSAVTATYGQLRNFAFSWFAIGN